MPENNTDKYPGLEGTVKIKKRSDSGQTSKEGSYDKKGGQ